MDSQTRSSLHISRNVLFWWDLQLHQSRKRLDCLQTKYPPGKSDITQLGWIPSCRTQPSIPLSWTNDAMMMLFGVCDTMEAFLNTAMQYSTHHSTTKWTKRLSASLCYIIVCKGFDMIVDRGGLSSRLCRILPYMSIKRHASSQCLPRQSRGCTSVQ